MATNTDILNAIALTLSELEAARGVTVGVVHKYRRWFDADTDFTEACSILVDGNKRIRSAMISRSNQMTGEKAELIKGGSFATSRRIEYSILLICGRVDSEASEITLGEVFDALADYIDTPEVRDRFYALHCALDSLEASIIGFGGWPEVCNQIEARLTIHQKLG